MYQIDTQHYLNFKNYKSINQYKINLTFKAYWSNIK